MGAHESTTATLSGRSRLVAYSAMAALATFALLLVLSLMYIRQSDELVGAAQAAYVHRDIELSLNDAVEFSNTIAGTFSSFAFIDAEQFRRMVAEKLGHSALFRAALYAPKIVEPTGFEAEMRRDGHEGYLVHDRGDDTSERSPWRQWYLPVSHREPQPPRALRDLGLDIGASPVTSHAIARARKSGALIRQVIDGLAPTLNGIWFIKAVYTGRAIPQTEPERLERFRGIVAVIVDPSKLFSEPLPPGMGYTLSMDTGPSRKVLDTVDNHDGHGFLDRKMTHEFPLGLDSGDLVLSLHCHHRWQVYDAGLILVSVLGGLGVGLAIFLLGRSWVGRAQVLADRNAHIENEVERQTQALRESETRLRESEQRMRAITQHAPGGISLKSLDGRFLFMNATFGRWFASDAEALVGWTNVQLYDDGEVIAQIDKMDDEVRKTLRATPGEVSATFPDGVARTLYLVKFPIFDDQGKHSAIGTIALDLSGQREAERARAESDAQFKELVESTVQGIFIHRHGKILFANQALADLLGMDSPDDALALDSIIDIFTPQEQARIREFKSAREQGLPAPDSYESKVQRTDGSVLNVEVSPKRVIWNGEAAIQGTMHDVTVWRRAEDSMRRRQQAAETANQAKSEFLANMSHELRTPLNGVLGVLELLDHSPLNEEQTDFVRTAMHSGETLLKLINDVLDLSKIEAGKLVLEQVDFVTHDLFDGVMHVVAPRAQEKSLRIDALIEPNVPSIVTSDPTRLRQIVLNLLANAVKFTEKGYVRLRVGYHPAAHRVSAGRLIVEISDSGIGISKQAKSQIFDAFSQADGSTTRRFGGTGLGLSISRHIIARMDGDVEVDSTPGKGSTFTVSVPVEVPSELAGDNDNAEVAGVRRKLAMLVVSRDAFTRASVVARAQALGLTAMSTETLSTIDSLIDDPEQAPLLVCIEHDLFEPSTLAATVQRVGNAPVQVAIMAPLGTPMDSALDTTGVVRLCLPIRTDDLSNLIDQCAPQSRDDPPMGEGTLTDLATLALVRDRARQVLVVEDNPVNLKVAEKMLERLGCVVTVARDGAEALDLLGEDPYDVILMDCQMPVIDGYESARRIRARSDAHSATPILALTANAMDGDEEKCLRAGMNAHISKPVTLARLEEELELWAPAACAVPTDGDTDVAEERAAVNG